jgi:hypothetical protein
MLANPVYGSAVGRPADLVARLRQLSDIDGHQFSSDSVSLRDPALFDCSPVGHRQLTNVHLLGLAQKRGGSPLSIAPSRRRPSSGRIAICWKSSRLSISHEDPPCGMATGSHAADVRPGGSVESRQFLGPRVPNHAHASQPAPLSAPDMSATEHGRTPIAIGTGIAHYRVVGQLGRG